MKVALTICVYGDFEKKDIRMKVIPSDGTTTAFAFQNILHMAGYDAELFNIKDTDIPT